tara:strand:+ start:1858 stop:2046 length:189 start_codon:yes stop_codon:yes gene_type:complete
VNDYKRLEKIQCAIQNASDEMREYINFHHKHDGGCSVEFESASDGLKEALVLVDQIIEEDWN